jgi:hypothetical protein
MRLIFLYPSAIFTGANKTARYFRNLAKTKIARADQTLIARHPSLITGIKSC